MNKEQIYQLAAQRYPIGDNVSDNDRDTLEMFRRIYSEGLSKGLELLYTKVQLREAMTESVFIGVRNYRDPKKAAR
jgi:hypothetical protein